MLIKDKENCYFIIVEENLSDYFYCSRAVLPEIIYKNDTTYISVPCIYIHAR